MSFTRPCCLTPSKAVNCYDVHGKIIPMERLWIGFPKTRVAKQLDIAFNDPGTHEDFLKQIFLSQDEIKKAYRGMEPLPNFWFDDWELTAEAKFLGEKEVLQTSKPSPLRPDQQDRAMCQTIAKRIWAEHPDMTIADMTKRPEIQIEGNGKAYRGKNTLRNWLKEVAPAFVRNRRGRPKKKATAKKMHS